MTKMTPQEFYSRKHELLRKAIAAVLTLQWHEEAADCPDDDELQLYADMAQQLENLAIAVDAMVVMGQVR